MEGFNSNGKVYHCNCDCERAAIQNRENGIQNTKKDWWQLRFISFPNERNSKYRQSITKFRSVTLDVAFTLSQVYHCASVLWTACVKSCSLSCAKICTEEEFAASASYFFPFTLCVWSDSQRKQKQKSLSDKSSEERIFGQFNLNRHAVKVYIISIFHPDISDGWQGLQKAIKY